MINALSFEVDCSKSARNEESFFLVLGFTTVLRDLAGEVSKDLRKIFENRQILYSDPAFEPRIVHREAGATRAVAEALSRAGGLAPLLSHAWFNPKRQRVHSTSVSAGSYAFGKSGRRGDTDSSRGELGQNEQMN